MGAMLLVRTTLPDAAETFHRGNACLARQGFASPLVVETESFLLALYQKQLCPTENVYHHENGDFCASVGTFLYRETVGVAALSRFYRDLVRAKVDDKKMYGSYCILVYRNGKLYLDIDALETYKLYEARNGEVISSSLIAGLTCLSGWSINVQALYEYVHQGATYGGDTIAQELNQLSRHRIANSNHCHWVNHPAFEITAEASRVDLVDSVSQTHKVLFRQFQAITGCFGDRIETGLSGGYDSRLTLALLLEQGVAPHLHVYGNERDPDVIVAKSIAATEKLTLDHIDKNDLGQKSLDDYPQVVEKNFFRFDGLPVDGVFNLGADLRTRELRCKSGALMLNGGGGEIFRNFFYLPNRNLSVHTLVSVFYSQYDPRATTRSFSNERYRQRLAIKIRDSIGTSSDRLTRAEADLVFPMFRCRYWMGMNNSMNNRLSYSLTPFIDHEIVLAAARIPANYKDSGNFESRLIQNVNRQLAAYSSAYGFDFVKGPGTINKILEKIMHQKPAWLRRNSFIVKNRLRGVARPEHLTTRYIQNVFPNGLQHLERFFVAENLADSGQFNRALTVSYLMQRYPPSS